MSVIAIAAVGFTMQFGITNMINLAYGEVMISSAYVAYYLNKAGITIWVGMIAGAVFGAVFSFLLNRVVYAPFLRRGTSHIGMVIVSLAVSLMVANLVLPIVGYYSVSYQDTTGGLIRAGGIVLTTNQIAIIGVAVVLMLLIHGLLRYTRLGKAMRATAANPTLARNCGIPTGRVIDAVWLITGALCGLAGVVAAMNSDSFAIANGAGLLITALAPAAFGVSGIVNFSFIVFQAVGAYTAAVLSLPPDSANGGFQIYFGGYQLPFPIPWIGGAAAGGLLSIPVGLVVLRRLRSDYQAIALLVLSIITNAVITNARPLLNGAAGLALVPPPFSDQIDPNTETYQFLYVGLTAICVLTVFVLVNRIVESPYGRTLRAMRERELAAMAIGKNPGLLIIGFLWFRPEGVRPEPRHVFEGAAVREETG